MTVAPFAQLSVHCGRYGAPLGIVIRSRTADAARCTVPFGLTCQTLTVHWYAYAGIPPGRRR